MKRVIVVGTSGSGKTTFARQLAQRMDWAHIELDNLHWEANWQEADLETLTARVTHAMQADGWVMDGNYGKISHLTWPRADTVIWLDYPRWLVMGRVIRRTARRVLTRQKLWDAGNVEGLQAVFGKDSIIAWAWNTYERRKREYPKLFSQPEHAHLTVIRFESPRAAAQWLDTQHRTEQTT